jgi:hypothetical protein
MCNNLIIGHLDTQQAWFNDIVHSVHAKPPKSCSNRTQRSVELRSTLWGKSLFFAQRDWFEPKFADQLFPLEMDMLWLVTIKTIKEQAVRTLNIF